MSAVTRPVPESTDQALPSPDAGDDPPLCLTRPRRAVRDDQVIGQLIPGSGRITGAALRKGLYLTTLAWVFGAFWMAAATGLAQAKLAKYLGADDRYYGLLQAVPLIAVLLQIPGSLIVDRLGKRKTFFIVNSVLHRGLYFLIGLLPWLVSANAATSALLMILLIFLSNSLNNLGGQAWASWMADLVPPRIRGKYFAGRSRYGIFVMILTGMAVGLLLDVGERPFLHDIFGPIAHRAHMPVLIFLISILFGVAAILGMMDILTFSWIDEPPMRKPPAVSLGKKLATPMRDKSFMRYCAYWSGWMFAVSWVNALWWPYLFDFFDRVSRSARLPWWMDYKFFVGSLIVIVAYQFGQFLGFPIWGRAIDKFGRKPVLFVSSVLHTLTWVPLAFLSPLMFPIALAAQIFGGVAGAGQDIANFNMMLEFNRKGGPGYYAFGSVVFSLAGAAGAILAGQLAESLFSMHHLFFVNTSWEIDINRYTVVIAIGILLKYAADFFLPLVQDQADKPAQQAMRFVFQNMYGNLNTMIFTPLRGIPNRAHRQFRQLQQFGTKVTDNLFRNDKE